VDFGSSHDLIIGGKILPYKTIDTWVFPHCYTKNQVDHTAFGVLGKEDVVGTVT
jgi:hypothetical protein